MLMISHVRLLRRVLLVGIAVVLTSAGTAEGIRIVTYNLLNYNGSTRAAQFKAILNDLQADILVVQEIASSSAPGIFLADVLNAADGPGGYARATFVAGPDTNNALFYRTNAFTFSAGDPDSFRTLPTELRDINRWKLRLVGYGSTAADVYVYSMHLKSDDSAQRAREAAVARNDANALPPGTNFLYCGDLNTQSSSEPCLAGQLMASMADNDGRAFDPINRSGTWRNNSAFADIHTQSPCNGSGCAPGAATGGMDDRFDLLLVSAALFDGEGFDCVPTTYRAYGNDGQHFNVAIDAYGFNNAVGLAMAVNLRQASDHLPVSADFQVPARIAAPGPDFGTAIVGTNVQRTLTVTNTGDVATFGYVDELDYTLPPAPAGFTGPVGSFVENPGGGGNGHVYTMDTSTPGPRAASITIASDADTPFLTVPFAGTVVTHARPSTSAVDETTVGTLDFGTHPAGGFGVRTATVYNYGYSAYQAPLEVHAAQFSGPDAARFSIVGGFAPATVAGGSAGYTIAFDDTGAASGTTYTATVTLKTRDASGIAGGGDRADLTFALTAGVLGACNQPRYDDDGDADVDLADFAAYRRCFNGPNQPFAVGCDCFDGDGDGDVDLEEFAAFQRCFSGPNVPANPACTG